MEQKKIIGTFVPLSALWSKTDPSSSGTLEAALGFLAWLAKTKQNAWQFLPLHETPKNVHSPYKSYGIGLSPKYLKTTSETRAPDRDAFLAKNQNWLPDYALFCALRDYFGTDNWTTWEEPIRKREPDAIEMYTEKLEKAIDLYITEQVKLHESYARLWSRAKQLGIVFMGDLAFYIAHQSPLVWTNQEIFDLLEDGSMKNVSGLPDSPTAYFGRQVWGHPLYRFEDHTLWPKILSFWKMRIDYAATLFDIIRFDHANGFFQYGSIDLTDEKNDELKHCTGEIFLEPLITYSRTIGLTPVVENLGRRLSGIQQSIANLSIPSARVFRFAYNERLQFVNKDYADIDSYPVNSVIYTTTHDSETLIGYLSHLTEDEQKLLAKAASVSYTNDLKALATTIRQKIINSQARIVIIPIQDWLLTTDRINIPGTEKEFDDKNWQFRLSIPVEKLPLLNF